MATKESELLPKEAEEFVVPYLGAFAIAFADGDSEAVGIIASLLAGGSLEQEEAVTRQHVLAIASLCFGGQRLYDELDAHVGLLARSPSQADVHKTRAFGQLLRAGIEISKTENDRLSPSQLLAGALVVRVAEVYGEDAAVGCMADKLERAAA